MLTWTHRLRNNWAIISLDWISYPISFTSSNLNCIGIFQYDRLLLIQNIFIFNSYIYRHFVNYFVDRYPLVNQHDRMNYRPKIIAIVVINIIFVSNILIIIDVFGMNFVLVDARYLPRFCHVFLFNKEDRFSPFQGQFWILFNVLRKAAVRTLQ